MKKILSTILSMAVCLSAYAQVSDAQKAAAEAAKTIEAAPEAAPKVEKPKYWTTSLKTQINVGQTGLFNWAAGGDNTVSLAAFIDGNANWKKNEMFWNNRLQLDYGFLYASSKPILQKSTDRIYLESKWGYNVSKDVLFLSANYDFKSQFSTGYDYKTPSVPDEEKYKDGEGNLKDLDKIDRKDQVDLWKDARELKSGFLAPAYTNLALGIDYKPTKWLSVNLAPVTGGFVIVRNEALRKSYSMELKKEFNEENYDKLTQEQKDAFEAAKAGAGENPSALGQYYRSAKFEFGAQLKADIKVNVNDNFSYSSQIVLFANYLDIKHCPRINWDNRFDWKIAKYFSFTLTTNMIYDDQIMITNEKDIEQFPEGKARLQFKESLAFGFTYTIASKK